MQEEGSEELMAGGIDWFRWHHGSVNDPKFRLVARRSCVRVGDVITMWALLLEQASAAVPRGHPGNIDFETIEMDLDLPEGAALAIYKAMVDRKLIDEVTGAIVSWERRQPKRERDPAPVAPDAPQPKSSTERARESRARKAASEPSSTTQRHAAPDEAGAAPSSATESQAAPREEERRVDTSLRSVSAQKPKKSKREYTAEFDAAWAAYPARPGNSKADAFKAWNARLVEGKTVEAMQAGVAAYATYCEDTGKTGTEYVKQAATFFGPGLHFETTWEVKAPPAKPALLEDAAVITRPSKAAEKTAEMLAREQAAPVTKPTAEQREALLRARQQASGKVFA